MLASRSPFQPSPVSGPVMIDKAAHAMKELPSLHFHDSADARFSCEKFFIVSIRCCVYVNASSIIYQGRARHRSRFIAAGSQCRTLICKLASRWAHLCLPHVHGIMVYRVVRLSSSPKWCKEFSFKFKSWSFRWCFLRCSQILLWVLRFILMENFYCNFSTNVGTHTRSILIFFILFLNFFWRICVLKGRRSFSFFFQKIFWRILIQISMWLRSSREKMNIRRVSFFFFFPGKIRPIRISRCRNGLLWILLVWQDEIVRTQSTN